MVYLTSAYNTWVVIASVLIAAFASYVALDLAKRVRGGQRSAALTWWGCGSLVMGTGIWSMHFVGMLAYSLPIALGYTKLLSAVSWLAGVGVSAIALAIAGSVFAQITPVQKIAAPPPERWGASHSSMAVSLRAHHSSGVRGMWSSRTTHSRNWCCRCWAAIA